MRLASGQGCSIDDGLGSLAARRVTVWLQPRPAVVSAGIDEIVAHPTGHRRP